MSGDNTEFFEQNPDGFDGEGLKPASYVLGEAIRLVRSWKFGRGVGGFRSTLQSLDKFITFAPKEVTVIGARPGMGKTALVIQLARGAIPPTNKASRIAIFSADMSGAMLLMRMAVAVVGVDIPTLRRGGCTEQEYRDVEWALRELATMPMWIADKSAPSYQYMKEQLEELGDDYALAGVIFDFMELMSTRGRTSEERTSLAMAGLKDIAKEFNVPVIALSQLNREVEDRPDKTPRLSDLRASGMIEQLADQVVLMMRPKYYRDRGMTVDTKALDKGLGATNVEDPCYLIVAKNRNGLTGLTRVAFDARKMAFYDIERVPLEPPFVPEPEDEPEPTDRDEDDPAALSKSLGLDV